MFLELRKTFSKVRQIQLNHFPGSLRSVAPSPAARAGRGGGGGEAGA